MSYKFEWPYQVDYSKEHEVTGDILIIGGGLAGSMAAIEATKRGKKVIVVDKAGIERSGSGGAGIDHWNFACSNPCCEISPEEMIEEEVDKGSGYRGEYIIGHCNYIAFKESYETLLDIEKMGLKFRDVYDEFAGADFRDDETKIMFAYDYKNKYSIRLRSGWKLKPILYREMKKRGVNLFGHIMITSLLNEGGQPGGKIIGATGVNVRTGEFYVFKAKATILATSAPGGMWIFSTDLVGSSSVFFDPNNCGDGHAIAWKAGAKFTCLETSRKEGGGFQYAAYGTANAHNTFFPCSLVDADGKEIPWVDRDGKILKTFKERTVPAPGQKIFIQSGPQPYETQNPRPIPDLAERIRKGEFKLPIYSDFPGMPELERRAIWGLMVGNEGKTRMLYRQYSKAGFDPDKDMLQAPVMSPEEYTFRPWWHGIAPAQWREASFFAGNIVTDWDLKTNLEGLYAAGAITGAGGAAGAASLGRYAARKAVEYVDDVSKHEKIDRNQVEEEKKRVYAPVMRKEGPVWKDLRSGLARIMQDYCGEYKHESTLKIGLETLRSIQESEAQKVFANNPHELWRILECFNRITLGEMIFYSSLERKASCKAMDFKRLDYPEMDPEEWRKFIAISLEKGEMKSETLPLKYWLSSPNASTYLDNYTRHCGI